MDRKKDWYKHKGYPHIGIPLQSLQETNRLKSYIKNPKAIAKHPFKPFIHVTSKSRRFRREIYTDGKRSKKRKVTSKFREIFYANNTDSNIYGYYSCLLSEKYEQQLIQYNIADIPTAYRTIPLEDNTRNKCNIDFAEDVFNYIRESKYTKLAAIAMDITSFFDNLDHKILKNVWLDLLNTNADIKIDKLPKDHFNVYRNITKFAYVDQNAIFNEFQNEIYVKKNNVISKMTIKDKKYLYNKNAIAYCDFKGIKKIRTKGYIKSNKRNVQSGELRKKGIPQGSSISALLANAYLFKFDIEIKRIVEAKNGLYRRYSDDLVIVVSAKHEQDIIRQIQKNIIKFKLDVQPKKTQIFWFIKCGNRYYSFEKNKSTNNFQTNTMFQYLGFSFDGKFTRLKSSSLASYYRKMKRSIKRGYFYSKTTQAINKRGILFKNRLYKRFTHIGAKRRRAYERVKGKTDEYRISHKYDWGNYLSYAYMASRIMKDNGIKKQLSSHWKKFHKLING